MNWIKVIIYLLLVVSITACKRCEHEIEVSLTDVQIKYIGGLQNSDTLFLDYNFNLLFFTDFFAMQAPKVHYSSFGPFGCEEWYIQNFKDKFWLESVESNLPYNNEVALIDCFTQVKNAQKINLNQALAEMQNDNNYYGDGEYAFLMFQLSTPPSIPDSFQFSFVFKDSRDSTFHCSTPMLYIPN